MDFHAKIIENGKYKQRHYSAPDEETVEDMLMQRGLRVLEITQHRDDFNKSSVGKRYLLQLFAKMRICYRINMPILQTLELCRDVIPNKTLKTVLAEIKQQVSNGMDLSLCLWKYPNIFPPVICRLVEVGSRSGKMAEACDKIFYMLNISLQTRRKVISAMYYPALVMVALIFALYVLITKTIPVFTKLFTNMHVDLPWPTKLLVRITDTLTAQPLVTFLCVVGVIGLIFMLPKIYRKSYTFQKAILRIFPFGRLVSYSQRLSMVSTLYTILDAQVPILPALRMTRNAVSNVKYKMALASAIMSVNLGKGMSQGLAEHSQLLTPELVKSMQFAEETGATVHILSSLQKEYEEGLEYQINLFKESINPIITLIIAVVVLFIMLSLFLPMFNLTKVIHA